MHKYFAYGFKFDPNTQPGLTGLVADTQDTCQKELSDVGTGFGAISDLKTGPGDGFLYVLSINDGTIYRVVPSSSTAKVSNTL